MERDLELDHQRTEKLQLQEQVPVLHETIALQAQVPMQQEQDHIKT